MPLCPRGRMHDRMWVGVGNHEHQQLLGRGEEHAWVGHASWVGHGARRWCFVRLGGAQLSCDGFVLSGLFASAFAPTLASPRRKRHPSRFWRSRARVAARAHGGDRRAIRGVAGRPGRAHHPREARRPSRSRLGSPRVQGLLGRRSGRGLRPFPRGAQGVRAHEREARLPLPLTANRAPPIARSASASSPCASARPPPSRGSTSSARGRPSRRAPC